MLKKLLAAAVIAAPPILAAPAAFAQDKIRFAVTDVDGMEALQREFGPFKAAFEKLAGLKVDFFPVSGRTAAVEAMAADQVDFVLTGPAEYVVFHARLKAQPVVVWTRPGYYSQIVTLENGPVKSFADLKGKKVSMGEIGSTSQHLGPAQIMANNKLAHGKDYEPVFLKLNVAVEALLRGDIGAIGMNRTHLERVVKAYPNAKFRVLEKGANLPDDLIIASNKVKPETVAKVRAVFANHSEELLKAVTATNENAKFIGGKFLPNVNDRDYDVVRDMFRAVNVNEFTKFIGN